MSIVPAGSAERTATAGRQFAGQVAEPLRRLMRAETGSAGLLLAATLTALLWANSPWSDSSASFWTTVFAPRRASATPSWRSTSSAGAAIFAAVVREVCT